MNKKLTNKIKRINRIRKKILQAGKYPRLSVFRSNKNFYAQIIDDKVGKTLISVNSQKEKIGKITVASVKNLGKTLGKEATKKKISSVVFDRGSYKYHGKIKSFAEGAREGGLKF